MDDALWQGLLGGLGGGGALLVIGWAALKWHLAEHFFTQGEGNNTVSRLDKAEAELREARSVASKAAERTERLEELLRNEIAPSLRDTNATLGHVREELAGLRVGLAHQLDTLRDVQKRLTRVETG